GTCPQTRHVYAVEQAWAIVRSRCGDSGTVTGSRDQPTATTRDGRAASAPNTRVSCAVKASAIAASSAPATAADGANPNSAAGVPWGPLWPWISRNGPWWLITSPDSPCSRQHGSG